MEPAVMIIDDDDHLREAMSLLLEAHGYGVDECRDAHEALARLGAGATPDVIVLDLLMPRMDGWQFRLEQKREARWAEIPVVALSGDTSPKARAIDAQVYLSKPVDEAVLLETVAQLVHALAGVRAREHVLAADSSIDALASVIAHEVNNPLSFVLGNLELAQRKADELAARSEPHQLLLELRRVLARGQRGAERIRAVMQSAFHTPSPSSVPPEPSALRLARRRPRVLVVDDEPMMCELIGALLAGEYEVTSFSSALAALHALRAGMYDVVLCDLMMPELNGMELYELLSHERPDLAQRFVFISGGAFTERARYFIANTRRPQVRKPFHRQELIDALETQLRVRN
ncbi:MAG TPA: response regulator [Polyangiales bacterium]